MSFKHKNRARKAALKSKSEAPKKLSKADQAYLDLVTKASKAARARRKDPAVHQAWRDSYHAQMQTPTDLPPTSDKIAAHGPKRTIYDSEWKRDAVDPEMQAREDAALAEARQKAKSVGITYNKGGYQYITPSAVKDLGKK